MVPFKYRGLEWDSGGYFEVSATGSEMLDANSDPWGYWRSALTTARSGNFLLIPSLVDEFIRTEEAPLAICCVELIGDAGNDQTIDRVATLLDADLRIDRALLCCTSLYNRGYLSDASLLLQTYVRYAWHSDADIIPVWLSDLIEPENGALPEPFMFEDIHDYKKAVDTEIIALTDRLGSKRAKVLEGELYSVEALAHKILRQVRQPFFRPALRHRFEAATGIDCRDFYRHGEVRPLAAAAIVEEFLESAESKLYQPGARYFFGHKIVVD